MFKYYHNLIATSLQTLGMFRCVHSTAENKQNVGFHCLIDAVFGSLKSFVLAIIRHPLYRKPIISHTMRLQLPMFAFALNWMFNESFYLYESLILLIMNKLFGYLILYKSLSFRAFSCFIYTLFCVSAFFNTITEQHSSGLKKNTRFSLTHVKLLH